MIPLKEITDFIKAGKKVQAVKLVMDSTGARLKDAKDYVDELEGMLKKASDKPNQMCYVSGVSAIDGMEGHEFEYFCADLLRKDGFSEVAVTPGSGDQGVDILAVKDGIKYAIQCKNYASALSNTPVQEVSAGKQFYGCHVGVVMTNSTFTQGAIQLAAATNVLLWDRRKLEELISKDGGLENLEISLKYDDFDSDDELDNYSHSYNLNSTTNPSQISPKQGKGCLAGFLVFVLLIVAIVFVGSSGKKTSEKSDELITLEQLQSQSHPKVADNEEDIKKYYKDVNGVSFEHASDFKSEKTAALTWHYTSVYGDDTLNHIVIDFSKLPVDVRAKMTFEKALDIAISFVPVEEILEFYAFDRAIYVEREDHIAHELYYKEIDEKVADRPSKYYQDHGFSIVIKEYGGGQFKVFIETSWYDYEYDIDSFPQNLYVTQEELDAHQEWQFSLEEYMNCK